jgi:hypothetical protein
MSIIDIAENKKSAFEEVADGKEEEKSFSWELFFSSLSARLFFLLLLAFDAVWFCYLLCKMGVYCLLQLCFLGGSSALQNKCSKNWVSIKRSLICALSLVVALFSPAFGIMIGCTYFLMYDKQGIEEVVPASLRSQFKDLFTSKQEL